MTKAEDIDSTIRAIGEIESREGASDEEKRKIAEDAMRETLRYLSLSASQHYAAKILEYASKRMSADAVLATLAAAMGSYIAQMYLVGDRVPRDLASKIIDSKLYYLRHFTDAVVASAKSEITRSEGAQETREDPDDLEPHSTH